MFYPKSEIDITKRKTYDLFFNNIAFKQIE